MAPRKRATAKAKAAAAKKKKKNTAAKATKKGVDKAPARKEKGSATTVPTKTARKGKNVTTPVPLADHTPASTILFNDGEPVGMPELAKVVPIMLQLGRTDNTVKGYAKQYKYWLAAREEMLKKYPDATDIQLFALVAFDYTIIQKKSGSTVQSMLYAVRYYFEQEGDDESWAHDSILKGIVKGGTKKAGFDKEFRKLKARAPITRMMLGHVVEYCDEDENVSSIYAPGMILGFCTLLRHSHMPKTKNNQVLWTKNWESEEAVTMEIFADGLKTSEDKSATEVVKPRFMSEVYAKRFKEYHDLRRELDGDEGPLFPGWDPNRALCILKRVAFLYKWPSDYAYVFHSLRHGGAMFYQEQGLTRQEIVAIARWSPTSKSFEGYTRPMPLNFVIEDGPPKENTVGVPHWQSSSYKKIQWRELLEKHEEAVERRRTNPPTEEPQPGKKPEGARGNAIDLTGPDDTGAKAEAGDEPRGRKRSRSVDTEDYVDLIAAAIPQSQASQVTASQPTMSQIMIQMCEGEN